MWLHATIFSGTLVFQRWHFGLNQIKGQRLPNASWGSEKRKQYDNGGGNPSCQL